MRHACKPSAAIFTYLFALNIFHSARIVFSLRLKRSEHRVRTQPRQAWQQCHFASGSCKHRLKFSCSLILWTHVNVASLSHLLVIHSVDTPLLSHTEENGPALVSPSAWTARVKGLTRPIKLPPHLTKLQRQGQDYYWLSVRCAFMARFSYSSAVHSNYTKCSIHSH